MYHKEEGREFSPPLLSLQPVLSGALGPFGALEVAVGVEHVLDGRA